VTIPDIKIDVVDVPYHYSLQRNRATEVLSKYLGPLDPMSLLNKALTSNALKDVAPEISDLLSGAQSEIQIPHQAIVVTWSGVTDPGQWLTDRIAALDQSYSSLTVQIEPTLITKFTQGSILAPVIAKASPAIPPELLTLAIDDVTGGLTDDAFRTLLYDKIGAALASELPTLAVPEPYIDLAKTDAGQRLLGILSKFVAGNEGKASLDNFELDLTNFTLNLQATLRHRHVWELQALLQLGGKAADMVNDLARLHLT